MRKYAYLARLEELLAALPAQERQEALNYYEEYFDAAGSENEEKTAEELGDPADVARNILEGEGIDVSNQKDVFVENAPAASPPDAVVAAPAGPEPPALENPESYPAQGTTSVDSRCTPKPRRLWLIFWLLVALALVIQLAVLALGLSGGHGGQTAFATVEYAESAPVSEASMQMAPTDTGLEASGQVAYQAALQTKSAGILRIRMNCGNVAFRTGDESSIQVRSVDASQSVALTESDSEDVFLCESTDPATHVTIVLPPRAYDSICVETTGSGAVELGDLQIRDIRAYTANGTIRSGWVQAGTLTLQTDLGSIWLEKATDGVGYTLETVKLLAPEGYVSADLDGPKACWITRITNAEGYSKTTEAAQSGGIVRDLEVQAGSTIDLQFDA